MGDKPPEQWQIDMDLCVDLYEDWSKRLKSVESPLSPTEHNGYLVLDYLICMEAGYYGQLSLDDASEPGRETLVALRMFGLDRYADDLQRMYARYSDPSDREDALSELSSDFDGRLEFEAAVAKYMRDHAA